MMETKGIPYGVSDYGRMTLENYYYVDKTSYIPLIEQAASFFFLIRPRRFGKSLMLSVLESYYDINNKDRFEEHCSRQFTVFLNRYEHLFSAGFRQEVMERPTADARLAYINDTASFLKLNLYLIIDEYDNFTHGEGFYRFFFNVIKAATTGSEQALKRMFITGVSPITLDDVTSGFNIGSNFSTDPRFNGIIGFSEAEVRQMLEYYRDAGTLPLEVDEVIAQIKPSRMKQLFWYGIGESNPYLKNENLLS